MLWLVQDNNCCQIYNYTVFGIFESFAQHKFFWILGECYCLLKKSPDIVIIIMIKSGKNYISFDNICLFFFFPCRRLPASWVGFCSISVDTCRVRLEGNFVFWFLFIITFNLSKVWVLRNYGVLIVMRWNKKSSFINHVGRVNWPP